MTAQVIFLNTFYYPDHEELVRLGKIQDKLTLNHIELAFQTKNMSRFQQYISKQNYHHSMRHSWLVYKGFKNSLLNKVMQGN